MAGIEKYATFLDLPEDVLMHIMSFCEARTLCLLGDTSKALNALVRLPLVWNLAYDASPLPLPPRPEESNTKGCRTELISATRLEENWISSRPSLKTAQIVHSPASAVWVLQDSTYLVMAHSTITSYLTTDTHTAIIGTTHLVARPAEYHLSSVVIDGMQRTAFAYSITHSESVYVIFVSTVSQSHSLSPQVEIKNVGNVQGIGAGQRELLILLASKIVVIHDLNDGSERYISFASCYSSMRPLDTIQLHHGLLVVLYGRHRCIDIDVFHLPPDLPRIFTRSEERDISLAVPLERSTVQIHQAQVAQLSSPRILRQNDDLDRPPNLVFDILAALPYALDHYYLRIDRNHGVDLPTLDLRLLGDDQPTRRPPSPSVNVRYANGSRDSYDSESTISRVMQPSQVLDLQISRSGRRAVAIHVAAHSNNRTIWCYSIPEGKGNLIAGQLSLGPSSTSFKYSEDYSSFVSVTGENMTSVLQDHACRAAFNEWTGMVVVAADCEELAILKY